MRIYSLFCQFVLLNGLVVSIERDKINNNSETIIVNVKDPDQGIDSAILPRLFTKFASKSYKDTGLGLFISKGIIEANGGKIWAENNIDGKGANFYFSLPLRSLWSSEHHVKPSSNKRHR